MLLSQMAFSVIDYAIVVAFVVINVYITANIFKVYKDVLLGKKEDS